jgi:uncharacterized repeat protein (TIGR01451 family)
MTNRPRVRFLTACALLLAATIATTPDFVGGPRPAHAQGGEPDILGTYDGRVSNKPYGCQDLRSGSASVGLVYLDPESQYFYGFLSLGPGDDPLPLEIAGQLGAGGQITNGVLFSLVETSYVVGLLSGSITAEQVNLTGSTMIAIGDINDPSTYCIFEESMSFSGTRTVGGGGADLSMTRTASPDPVASGELLTITTTVSNAGPDAADFVFLKDAIPHGTTFVSLEASRGQFDTPLPGETGEITGFIGSLGAGESATITLVVRVLEPDGATLSGEAIVSSATADADQSNNSAAATAEAEGGGVVEHTWDEPSPDEPLAPPTNLQAHPASADGGPPPPPPAFSAHTKLPTQVGAPGTCTIAGYVVYASNQQPVETNLQNQAIKVGPTPPRINIPVLPGGSYYRVTAIWNCGGVIHESPPSNEVGVGSGGVIEALKVKKKIKAIGRNFTSEVEVFIDGVGFAAPARVKNGQRVTQGGTLSDGRTIAQAIPAGREVLLTFRNSDGGISTVKFTK